MRDGSRANKNHQLLAEHLIQKYQILGRLRQLNPVAFHFNYSIELG